MTKAKLMASEDAIGIPIEEVSVHSVFEEVSAHASLDEVGSHVTTHADFHDSII